MLDLIVGNVIPLMNFVVLVAVIVRLQYIRRILHARAKLFTQIDADLHSLREDLRQIQSRHEGPHG